jgi:DNA helicase-4
MVSLTFRGKTLEEDVYLFESLTVFPGAFWSTVSVPVGGGRSLRLDGIPNADALHLKESIAQAVKSKRDRLLFAELLRNFDRLVQPVTSWANGFIEQCKSQLKRRGWLTSEFVIQAGEGKPKEFAAVLQNPGIARHLEAQPDSVKRSVDIWRRELPEFLANINQRHADRMARDDKAYFDTVESSPLTPEQRSAVVCFDNRVLLVASAGSGKTSTMVAKAGYALRHGYFAPDKILLLAFNNDAAKELRERIEARLSPLGLSADKVVAKTFHAFGLEVIGAATGKRPSLAPWVESGQDLETILQLADDLKDSSVEFRATWDLFRIVLGQDLPKFGKEQEAPDAWDSEQRRGGFWTLNNEVVKSRGELVIANWLFYNGVRYVYEGAYEVATADAIHRQYRPDFYLPDAKAYLEHWAIDENGKPPAAFRGYEEGMVWKRQLHAQHGTRLLETTMAELWSGRALAYLTKELTSLGVALDPNPERPAAGRKPIENPRLARTFRSFLTHAKSNRLGVDELRKRLRAGAAGEFRFRHEMFLRLFEQIWATWESKLRSGQHIDFEDMLNQASDCIEKGAYKSPFELVMVDEFQDASQARARLVAGLLNGSDKFLFAVGDDWQSINRFAGADLSVMTDFEKKFGKSVTLRLETTFRCPPSLCDISSRFVGKNPRQISKKVRSPRPNVLNPVRIVSVKTEHRIRSAVEFRLNEIASEAEKAGRSEKVYLLGRYRKDSAFLPGAYNSSWVDVEFFTVHSSKGLEADHVIVPRMTSESLGFPSRIADDPVLQLAMPGGDTFEYAEERRLFYVALTRARQTVTLITIAHQESPFISELVREEKLQIRNADGSENSSEVCPGCQTGFLVPRKGKFGQFVGCSAFPRCTFTRKISEQNRRTGA